MDTDQLNIFLHLSDSLHFGKTSMALNMSPSTLSRQIQKIEAELEMPLFLRDNRSVSLSPQGVEFKKFAREFIDKLSQFKQLQKVKAHELHGEITMYCSVTASYTVLSSLLPEFRKLHPYIEINLKTGEPAGSIDKVIDGEVDVVIAARPDKLASNLDFISIVESPLLFIGPKVPCLVTSMLKETPIPWSKIPMIFPEKGLARKRVNQWFRSQNIKPNIYAQVLGNEGIVSMVNLGFGVGVVPDLVVQQSLVQSQIETINVPNPLKPYDVGVCSLRKTQQNPLVHAFWEVSREYALNH